MKQKLLLKTMLLLCALIVGSGSTLATTKVTWVRVTSMQELFEGGTFIMGYEATAKSGVIIPLRSKDCGATTSANGIFNSGTTNSSSTSGTIDMSDLSKVTTSDFEVYITGIKVKEVYTYINIQRTNNTGNYYGATSGGTSKNTARLYTAGSSNETNLIPEWSSQTNNQFKLSANVSGSYKYLKYNTGSPRYAFYNSAGEKVVFYKKVVTHTLTYSATNGSIEGEDAGSNAVVSGADVAEGATVELSAVPASGYSFTGWSVSGTGASLLSTSTNPTTFTMGTADATVTATFISASACAEPTFTIDEGTYNEAKSVEIECITDGATIYYTTDGTDPTNESSVYSSAIAVNVTTTIKAIAVADGLDDSDIASATYTLKCATPAITVPGGLFLDTKEVTMTSTDGASIFYTTDESTPNSSSTAYDPSNKPSISATTTIKAIATKSGWSDSDVATETFTKITPLTVAEALTAIAALANNGTIANQYVRGVVSTTGSISSGSVTYYISADGTTTSQLQVYKGKGIDGADFTALTNLELGDEVVVFGTLKNYNGTTPEFDAGSQVVNRVTKATPTFSLDISSKTLDAYTKESVDVTLTTNTDGAITCESDDEDVATVALKSGNVYTITAKTEGNATITIRSAASANYKSASATVAITVEDTRDDAGISFAEDAIEKTWGASFAGQALTNTNSVAVTWSSTDEAVATVTSTGVVTIQKAGSTTIKATFAGNATYKAAVASYTLTVNKAEAGISYSETSFDVELDDDSFVAPTLNNPNALEGITYSSNNTTVATVNASTGALSLTTSAEGTVKITATFAGNDNYKSGSANYTINVIDPSRKGTKLNPYTVAEVEEQATATTFGNNIYVTGYIVGSVKNNKCYKTTTANLVNTNLLLADTPDVSFTEGATVASNTDGLIPVELPSSPSSLRTNWGVASNNVIGYKIILKGNAEAYFGTNAIKGTSEISAVSIPAKFNASGYATYASTYPLDFSDDSEYSAWQITGVSGSAITFSQITGTVAAGTGVLLKGTASSSINIPVAASGTDISGTNKLEGIITATAVDNNEYYGLSGNVFKKVNAGTVPAGKALLPASEVSSARELTFVFEGSETTGISDASRLKDNGEMRNDNFFNLKGQRVVQPTKGGLYIVNGKKVVIK